MAFKKGEAPWELEQQAAAATAPQGGPSGFARGQAPWELQAQAAPIQTPTEPDQFSTGESALQGAGQSLSFGYLPELQAGADVLLSRVLPESMGGDRSLKFQDALKQWRSREQAVQSEDPLAYGAGAVAGGMALPVPGLNVARTGTGLARAAKAALAGAGTGAIYNPGETDNQLAARAQQALTGGVMSGGLSSVASGLSSLGRGAKKAKEALAIKLAGGRKAHMKEFPAGSKKREDLVKFMEKEGMIQPGSSYEQVLDKSTVIVEEAGSKLGNLYKAVGDDIVQAAKTNPQAEKVLRETALNARRVAADVLRSARKELKGTSGGQDALKFLQKELRNLADLDRTKIRSTYKAKPTTIKEVGGLPTRAGGVPARPGQQVGEAAGDVIEMQRSFERFTETPFDKLLRYRQSLDDNLNWQKSFGESKGNEKALKIARDRVDSILTKRIETVDKVVGTSRAKQLKPLKDRYQKAKNLQRISADRTAGEEAKVNLGLLETIAGTGIAGSQIAQGTDPATALTKGLVGGIALRQARKYGPGLSYRGLSATERGLRAADNLGNIPSGGLIAPWLLMGGE